jgi:hypothetical protein
MVTLFLQAGLRMQLTPDMSFEKVQRLAFSLGTSLRQTILQSKKTSAKAKVPVGSKTFRRRPGSFHSLKVADFVENHDFGPNYSDIATSAQVKDALAHTQLQSALFVSSPLTGHRSWESSSRSPSPSVVSIPTRGWVSSGGSVMSEPMQRTRSISPSRVGGNKPPICFLWDRPLLAECPRLPPVPQKEAADNREYFQKI